MTWYKIRYKDTKSSIKLLNLKVWLPVMDSNYDPDTFLKLRNLLILRSR
jgi:hypothetical protein